MVQKLSERAADVHNRRVDPSQDNMLTITNDGRKIGLDQRLINDMLPDDPDSKVNLCMENVFRIWEETADKRLTQLVFCDFSTPKENIWTLSKEQQEVIKDLSKEEKRLYLAEHIKSVAKAHVNGEYPDKFNVYDDSAPLIIA